MNRHLHLNGKLGDKENKGCSKDTRLRLSANDLGSWNTFNLNSVVGKFRFWKTLYSLITFHLKTLLEKTDDVSYSKQLHIKLSQRLVFCHQWQLDSTMLIFLLWSNELQWNLGKGNKAKPAPSPLQKMSKWQNNKTYRTLRWRQWMYQKWRWHEKMRKEKIKNGE